MHLKTRLAVAVAAALALPASAQAADAPLRGIGVDTAGTATAGIQPVAISPDGKEVLGDYRGATVIRDVAAGVTRRIIAAESKTIAATPDLQRIVFETSAALSPKDVDTTTDAYVFDRRTGGYTLVSQDPVTGSLAQGPVDNRFASPSGEMISADGKVVVLDIYHSLAAGGWVTEQYRFDLVANKLTRIADVSTQYFASSSTLDDAGQVTVNGLGIFVGGVKRWPLPFDASGNARGDGVVSADGSTVGFSVTNAKTKLTLVNVATGAVSSLPLPAWLQKQWFRLDGLTAGGAKAILSTTLNQPAGPRYAYATLDKAGTLAQIGGDIPYSGDALLGPITQNLQFAATSLYLAQMGSIPLPGTNPPPAPNTSTIRDFFSYGEPMCSTDWWGIKHWSRGYVALRKDPVGAETRKPVKADVSVYTTSTKKVINAFTILGGASREITVGHSGGWSISAKVSMSDGTTLSTVVDIPVQAPYCNPPVF